MVYILLSDGFEEIEAVTPYDLLSRAGIPVFYVGVRERNVTGGQGTTIVAHMLLKDMDLAGCEMIVLPGGRRGVENLLRSTETLEAIKTVWAMGGYVAAICAAPTILARLGLADGKQVTCYPDEYWIQKMGEAIVVPNVATVTEGKLITGTSAGCGIAFGLELVAALRGREVSDQVRQSIVWR